MVLYWFFFHVKCSFQGKKDYKDLKDNLKFYKNELKSYPDGKIDNNFKFCVIILNIRWWNKCSIKFLIVYDVTISCTVIVLKHVHVIKMILIIGTPINILADISVDISFILTRVSVKQFEILICIFQRHLDLLLISRVVSPVKYWVIF